MVPCPPRGLEIPLKHGWMLEAGQPHHGRCMEDIWMFPKIVVPPNHPKNIGFSIINHPFWGYHYFRKHPYINGTLDGPCFRFRNLLETFCCKHWKRMVRAPPAPTSWVMRTRFSNAQACWNIYICIIFRVSRPNCGQTKINTSSDI